MFYDGILCAIISKGEKNHEIIDKALNYLKLNKRANAKVLTDIPYLIFNNLDFLNGVKDYTIINVKASINEFKRDLDLKLINNTLKRFNIKYYGARQTGYYMQVFIEKIDLMNEYKLYHELKEIPILSLSSKLIIYEAKDIFSTDLINNNYLSNYIIINSGNNLSLDKASGYLGEITNLEAVKKGFLRLYNDLDFNYNYYADVIDYLSKVGNKDLSEIVLSIIPEYFKTNFNDYYNRIYTPFEGPLYMISTNGSKLSVIISKDNAFDVYVGFDNDNIYLTNENINLFNPNKFYSVKNYLEIDLNKKDVSYLFNIIDNIKEKDNKAFVIENGDSSYEALFDMNEDLIEICKEPVLDKTFLNGMYPSMRKTKLDMYYTNYDLSKSIYFKNVFLSLVEYENILKLKNEFNICELKNNDLEYLVNEGMEIIIINDNDFEIYSDLINLYSKKVCFIILTEKYEFKEFAYYLSSGVSLIYPYKAYMTIKGLENKNVLNGDSINSYLKYLKNNLSRVMASLGIHYIKSFVGCNLYHITKEKKLDKLMLIKLEDALKANNYDKYLDYSNYLNNAFKYKDEISTDDAVDKETIKRLFKCILPVSDSVKKYLNDNLDMDYTVLDKRFINKELSKEILIDFTDDSINIPLTDYNMYKKHKIIPNTPFLGLKHYYDIYSFKDLKALVLELKELRKDAFIMIKISNIENIIDYVTSGVDEIIIDNIDLLKCANDILINNNLRDNVLLSLEDNYYNAYDIIKAGINGSNRFYFKKSILLSLGCNGFNKCYKCPSGIFGNLTYYGNDLYLKRFLDFISYETYVTASLIGFNSFNTNYKNYLEKESNINDVIVRNAKSGITDMSCNALGDNNIGAGLHDIDKKVFVRINGNVGYNFGSYLKSNITLSLNGVSQKYLGKCLDGGTINVFNNTINEINDEKNYLVGKNALYKANSGKVFIDGYASSFFALANNGATALVLGMDDFGCSYMTNGVVVCLGEIGNNFAYNMTGGIAYIYDEKKDSEIKIDKKLVDVVKLDGEDLVFLTNLIDEFKEVTNSKRGKALAKFINPEFFIKVVPKNYSIMLKTIKQKQKSGLSFDEAIKEVK